MNIFGTSLTSLKDNGLEVPAAATLISINLGPLKPAILFSRGAFWWFSRLTSSFLDGHDFNFWGAKKVEQWRHFTPRVVC